MFYAIRHIESGKLLVQHFRGMSMVYMPTARKPDDVEHLQQFVAFKTTDQAQEFVKNFGHRILTPSGEEIMFNHLEIVGIEFTLVNICTDKVYRMHVVTDQGNGGAYCSKCGHNLDARHNGLGLDIEPAPNPCPGCGREWEDTTAVGYSYGGSDF